jgi:hypothetical protein
MPINPPPFSKCLAADGAVIERWNGVKLERGRSQNGIEVLKWPQALVTVGSASLSTDS